jgi:hypothetical protein
MNGETIVTRFDGLAATAQRTRMTAGQNDTTQSPDRQELVFSDPALDEFASAMTLKPLPLARWLFSSAFRAVSRFVKRILEIGDIR